VSKRRRSSRDIGIQRNRDKVEAKAEGDNKAAV
jgi:hypothetical protein